MTTNETPKTTNFLPGQEGLPSQLSADYGGAVELAGEENKGPNETS